MAPSTVVHYVGRLAPSLSYIIKAVAIDGTIQPWPVPPDASVEFHMVPSSGGDPKIDGEAATVINPAADDPTDVDAGKVRYDWAPADVDTAEEYVAWFRVEFAGGATQDTPEFWLVMRDHVSTLPPSVYTSVTALKDFTSIEALKEESDEWLAEAVIPRAEAWLSAWGPFTTPSCPGLRLAANILSEFVWRQVVALRRTEASAHGGAIKSESIGSYSYSLTDVLSQDPSGWDALTAEIANLVSACRVWSEEDGEVIYGSAGEVFQPVGTFKYDRTTGELTDTFEVAEEVLTLRWRWVVWS